MAVKLGIHNADQLLQRQQLLLHPALVSVEVLFLLRISTTQQVPMDPTNHAIHDLDETPKRHFFVSTHDDVDWGTEVGHALHITCKTKSDAITYELGCSHT